MLRGVLGDSLFFDCMHAYASNPSLRYGHATTEDFEFMCEAVSGMELDFFFEQWVYGEYFPRYRHSYQQDDQTLAAVVTIKQIQSSRPYFEMPVQLQFLFPDQTDTLVTVWNDGREQEFEFDFEQQIVEMRLDPDHWILCQKLPLGAEDNAILPHEGNLVLQKIYPNPCRREATIHLSIPGSEGITVRVYDLQGHVIRSFLPEPFEYTGQCIVRWDGADNAGHTVPAGTYIVQTESASSRFARKLIVLP
jgi:hypothetical protein